jgi:ketosteroid isomerase-like protein
MRGRMKRYNPLIMRTPVLCVLLALIAPAPVRAETAAELKEQVRQTEIAFARSMADRDPAAFASFLTEDTVFMSGGSVLRGVRQVADGWKAFFNGAKAPFSWEPEHVEVLESGTLAMSSGPVKDPSGKRVGTFNSVWRREAGGRRKIVIDNGCPACDCANAVK